MKFNFQDWKERLRARMGDALERLRGRWAELRSQQRSLGITPLPGSMITFSAGRLGTFRIPRLTAADWEKLYRKSFLYNSIAAMICAYFMADLLVASLLPWVPQAEAPRPRLNLAGARKDFRFYEAAIIAAGQPHLFSWKGLVPDNDEGGDINGPPVRTSLPLTLLGIIRLDDPAKSVASIEDKGQNQVLAVRVGDPISRDAIVQVIEEKRVIFVNQASQRREFVELPQDQILASVRSAPAKPSGTGGIMQDSDNHYTLARSSVDDALKNMNEILTQARCVPELENGKPAGYRCFQIVPGSIYEQLGMQDNDVICGIDGEPINDLAAAFNKLNGLKTAKSISLCLKRNGRVTNKQYDIP